MEEAKNQRRAAKGRFTRKLNEVNKSIDGNTGVETVRRHYEELIEAWRLVDVKHDMYTTFLDDREMESSNAWIEDLQEKFSDVMKRQIIYEKERQSTENNERQEKARVQEIRREQDLARRAIEQAFTRRRSAEAIFEQVLEDVNSSPPAILNKAKDQLEIAFHDCKQANDECMSLLAQENANVEISWIVALQKLYNKATIDIESRIAQETSIQETARTNNLRLEKIKMPRFEGELREYPRFKVDFQKQVMPSLSAETASYTLRSCLGKEPLSVVKSVGDNLEEMWRRLDERYGDPAKTVDAIIDSIRKVRPIRDGENKRLIEFIDIIEDGYRDLKRLALKVEITTTSSVSIIEKKLPASIKKDWAKLVTDDDAKVNKADKFPTLLKFLLNHKRAIEYDSAELRLSTTSYKSAAHHVTARDHVAKTPVKQQNSSVDGKPTLRKCLMHENANHWTDECRAYLTKPVNERMEIVKNKKACWSCLKTGHIFRDCKRKRYCGENGRTKRHNKTLHDPEENKNKDIMIQENKNEENKKEENKVKEEKTQDNKPQGIRASSCHTDSLAEDTCLLQFQKIRTPKGFVNVMWDNGTSLCFITDKKAKELKLTGKNATLTIVRVGGKTETLNSRKYELSLIDKEGQVVRIEVFEIEKITSEIQKIDIDGVIQLFKDVKRMDIDRPKGPVDVLIGYEYAGFHPVPEQKVGHLLLLRNRFGRCLGGNHPLIKDSRERHELHAIGAHHVGQVAPKVDLESFYKIENLGIECTPRCGNCKCGKCPPGAKNFTLKEERELKLIEENLSFNEEENRWVANYPWIRHPTNLPDNRKAAMGMLISTEKRLAKNPNNAKVYKEQIDDMIARGVARKLTPDELKNYDGPVHYISHHEILRQNSTSTPVRIVFNSSAKYMGHALNDYWAKGPDLLNNLLGVLIRFREDDIALTGDIKKMYHTVKIGTIDQHTHRFLWRNMDNEREPDTYIIQRVSFGDKPAGTIPTVALRKTAEKGSEKFPQAAKTIMNNTYMDDIVDRVPNQKAAKTLAKDIEKMLQKGRFQIKYWTFSDEYSQHDDTQLLPADQNSLKTEKILGVEWSPVKDQFYFNVHLNFSPKKRKLRTEPDLRLDQIPKNIPEPLTKRAILS